MTHTHAHTHTHYSHGKQALGTPAEPAVIPHIPSYRHPGTASLLHKGNGEPERKGEELIKYGIPYVQASLSSQALPRACNKPHYCNGLGMRSTCYKAYNM